MSYVKFSILRQCIIHIQPCLFLFSHWLHFSLHSLLEIGTIIIVIKRKEYALRCPYRTHVRAKVISEIEEVQEHMKADMEGMKDLMAAMMETMLSMKKIMESNAAAIATMSAATEVNPTHPSGLNQVNPPIPNMVRVRTRQMHRIAQVV